MRREQKKNENRKQEKHEIDGGIRRRGVAVGINEGIQEHTHAIYHATLVPDRPSQSWRRQPRRKPSGLTRVKKGHKVEESSRSISENEDETDIKKAIEKHMMKAKKLNEKLTEIQK